MSDDQLPFEFDGESIHEDPSAPRRLSTQYLRVHAFMSDGKEHHLDELAGFAGGTSQAVSARLRDMRKPRFGKHAVVRRHIGGGLFGYRAYRSIDCPMCEGRWSA